MKFIIATYGLELVLLVIALFFSWIGFKLKMKPFKHLLFNLVAIVLAFMLYELTLTLIGKPKSVINHSHQYMGYNSGLGYGVADSVFSVQATKQWKETGEKIYDAKYSFANGRRVTPNSNSLSNQYGLFIGGSFTMGEGINDHETLPYLYNEKAPEKINIRNYGFHGYGTHQVYHIIKNQIANDTSLLNADQVEVFYWFFNDHIARASGYSPWDQDGPLYTMNADKFEYTGSFKEMKQKQLLPIRGLKFLWEKSAIFQMHLRGWWISGTEEVNHFLNLVKESDKLLKRKGFKFTVLIQDISMQDKLFAKYHQGVIRKIKQDFKENDISYIVVNEMPLQQIDDYKSFYIPGDGHPTGEFNRQLASFLWDKK